MFITYIIKCYPYKSLILKSHLQQHIHISLRNTYETNHDQHIVIGIIGHDNYLKLLNHFGKSGIYFSSSSVMALKNRNVNNNDAARILEVSNKQYTTGERN
ncbi:MAG: hypothetical protein P4L45_01525, partial [Ignavibacteriaceae bacterium]|nr:hypothetical protein [Ignavibacteriaceae bacterium]